MNTIPRKLGRYAIIREIGRGAMGVVYKAHDPIIERDVAIKAIQISYQVTDEEHAVYLSRFHREAKAAGKLSHPNIVTVFDVDEDKETGTPFIVMEFLEGTTVADIISSGVILPLEDVNHMIRQLADALHYAHSEGVVHRDIKSANVLVLPGMKVKIMDFGIARLPSSSSDLTSSGQFVGTPNYMSPEQLEGKVQVDGRSDLFSLGVVFYMLLTGERPFAGESFNTVAYKIVHMEPAPLRRVNPNIPDAYNAILDKLLAKNPEDRYQVGAELVDDLKKLDASTPELIEVAGGDPDKTLAVEEVTVKEKPQAPAFPPTASASGNKRWLFLGAVALLAVGVAAGVFFFRQQSDSAPAAGQQPSQPDPLVAMSRQNSIRIKWDLAVNYQLSGKYDQSIRELHAILKLDPANEEAKKFLDLVNEKKAEDEKRKAEESAAQTRLNALAAESSLKTKKTQAPRPKSSIATVQEAMKPAEDPEIPVELTFEHTFPSGTLYVYVGPKLVLEAPLEGVEKRVLMFKKYKGKVIASLKLPLGESDVRVHVICKEQRVSAFKQIRAVVSESGPKGLRVRYLENPKQLELKWI